MENRQELFIAIVIAVVFGGILYSLDETLSWQLKLLQLLLFVIIMYLCYRLWLGIRLLKKYIDTPNRKNIKLTSIKKSKDTIALKIRNREWRRPYITIKEVITTYIKNPLKPLEHGDYKKITPIAFQLDKCQKREIEFIKLRENSFNIINYFDGRKELISYSFGDHLFTVGINYYYLQANSSNNLSWFDLEVSYYEQGKIKHAEQIGSKRA